MMPFIVHARGKHTEAMDALPADTIEVRGLSLLLDEEDISPVLALQLGAGDQRFQVMILAVDEEWVVNVRDERGHRLTDEPELYPTRASAILAAMLMAIDRAG
jgi:hypothetical protein